MNFFLFIFVSLLFFYIGIRGHSKNDRRYAFLYVTIVSIIFGFRTDTPDTESYVEFYSQIEPFNWIQFGYSTNEIGFQFVCHVLKYIIGNNSIIYLFFWDFVMGLLVLNATKRLIIKYKTIHPNKRTWIKCPILLCMILFYAYYGCFYGCIAIRASIAVGFGLIVISLLATRISTKNILISLLLIALSYLIHTSSIIILIIGIITILNYKLKDKEYLLIWAFAFVIFFSRMNQILIQYIIPYIGNIMNDMSSYSSAGLYVSVLEKMEYGMSFKYIFQLLCGLLFITVRNKDDSYYKFMNIYLCGLVAGALLAPIAMAYRVLDFFYIVTYLLLFYYFSSRRSTNIPMFIFVVITQIILVYRVCY